MGASYNQNDFVKTYLTLREFVASQEQARINAAKYDEPCHSYDDNIQVALFFLACLEDMECYTLEEKYKLISKANRLSKNCTACPGVTDAEIDAFMLTDEGRGLLWQADLPEGSLLFDDLTFLVYYDNGKPVLFTIN